MDIYSKLASGRKVHASPFEHVAKPMGDSPSHEDGVTHNDDIGNYWSGNFKGWIQLRQTLDSKNIIRSIRIHFKKRPSNTFIRRKVVTKYRI